MPVYNVTSFWKKERHPLTLILVDDSSPLFTFDGAWTDVVDESYNGTLHSTFERNARAILDFQGTAIHVFGNKGPNHGAFQATMDGGPVREFSTQSDILEQQAELLSWSFTNGRHTLSLQATYPYNQATAPLDIDYAIITTGDGNTSTLSRDIVLDDTSANFTYSHRFDAGANDLSPHYLHGTFHLTEVDGAYANLSFYGNAVSIYGATSGNHGKYMVTLDNDPPLQLTGHAPAFRPQNLLYMKSGLSSRSHNLIITNVERSSFVDIDYAVISIWEGYDDDKPASHTFGGHTTVAVTSTPDSTMSTSGTPATFASGTGHPVSAAVIAGGVMGTLILLGLLTTTLFLVWRRMRSRRALQRYEAGWARTPAWGQDKSEAATTHHNPAPRWYGPTTQ